MIAIREAFWPDDAAAVAALDTSFTTGEVLSVEMSPDEIRLRPAPLAEPLTKRFPLDDLRSSDRPWDHAWVAEEDGACRGFAAVGLQAWNRRLVLWHLYVDSPARRRGMGRRLVERAIAHGRDIGASHLWLETSHLNAPGVQAYRRMGFELCGVDATLYRSTPADGEVALFFALLL